MSDELAPEIDEVSDGTHPEPPSDEEVREQAALDAQRPNPRQPAYDAVYEYLGSTNRVPGDLVTRNAMIWRAVNAALDATPIGRCVSSHCVEDDHILIVPEEQP
jgi:hypothetical protein